MKFLLPSFAALSLGASSLPAAEPLLNQLPVPSSGWLTSELSIKFGTAAENDLSPASPGFRTASNGSHVYVTGWTGRTAQGATRYDGFITKLDQGGVVLWTKSMREITGSPVGWPINDIAVEGNEIYVCGTRDETGQAFVAKLTDTGSGVRYDDFTHVEGLTNATVSEAWATARSIAISTVNGERQIVVGGEIKGSGMRVMEKGRTTTPEPRFTNLVVRTHIGNEFRYTDGWVMTFDGALKGTWGNTWGVAETNDSITAVAADNTGKVFVAIKSEAPDTYYLSTMSQMDDLRKTVTDANQAGTPITGGAYYDYDFYPGSNTLLFRLDTVNEAAPMTHWFSPCLLQSAESGSNNQIRDISYLGGKLYVWGEWSKQLVPVSGTQGAPAGYSSLGSSSPHNADCFLGILSADNLHHEHLRFWQSTGDDRALELTVGTDGLYVAGRAGAALSTRGGAVGAVSSTSTSLPGESTAPHLFWDKVNITDLSHLWHVTPAEGGGASIPSLQRTGGIGVTGTSVMIVGTWNGGSLTMGPISGAKKTLQAPAAESGFVGFLGNDSTWKQGINVDIVSAYGNPAPQRGRISLTAGGTINASVEPVVYEDAAGRIINPEDANAINSQAVTRRICTGYQFKNSTVNGTANSVSFVAATDMELTFHWRTEHAVEVESDLATSDGLTSPAAGDPSPIVQKHWIAENDQFTAMINGAATDIGQPGVRWRSKGYVAEGCVATAAGIPSGNTVSWAYQPRQQTPKITVGGPGRIRWLWEKEYSIRVSTNSSVAANSPTLIEQGATVPFEGSGEFWGKVGATFTASAPASVSSGISTLTLKGYTAATGSVRPYDQRGVSSVIFTLDEPSSITWDYARTVYPETVVIGRAVSFSGVAGVDATNVNRNKAPVSGNVITAPSGSTVADMYVWDAFSAKALVLRPGKFTLEFENKSAPNDTAQNVIVEVNAVWGAPDYTHILETPPVDLDPSTVDSLKLHGLAWSAGGGQVTGTMFATPEPGRSVLLYSSRVGGAATGNLLQEPLVVKVVNTLPWAASAQGHSQWSLPVEIGQAITSTDHEAAVGHNGYLLSPLAPVNAFVYDRYSLSGPMIPVNENFPDAGRWASGSVPTQTRLLAGRIIEFNSADDLLLDPATAKVAVSFSGDTNRTVKGVLFQTDGFGANPGDVTANGITVRTTAMLFSNRTSPAFSGSSSGELSDIMSDSRFASEFGSLDVTISGLTPGQAYNLQLLTNEGSTADRRFDIEVNGALAVDNHTTSGHSSGRRYQSDNSYAWSAEYIAPSSGILLVRLAKNLGGNPATGADNNPLLNALVIHEVDSIQGAGGPTVHEPGSLAVAWYQLRDGIRWPWKAARYVPQWPASAGHIVTASRLGSEGKKANGDAGGQQEFGSPPWSDPVIYHQPLPDAMGYNPNEEHSLIAPSFLEPARPAAFALRADLNRIMPDAGFTSKPYTLVQYTDKTDEANPVVKMAVYSVVGEDDSITDTRLPAFNQTYTYFYEGEAGKRLLPPYPLDVVIGPSSWPEETNAENVGGRVAYHEDKKHNAWILSGDTDAEEDIRIELYYPLRADFWHPTLEPGDVMPLGHLRSASPIRNIRYNTVWPANVAVLKAGETLTFPGGEYATDRSSEDPRPLGLPGVVAWQCGKLLFDSANPTMSPIQSSGNYLGRLFPSLSKREVPLALNALPDELKPASGNVIVEGLIWRFKKLPASLQKRCYYDSSTQMLGFRGSLNDRHLGDGDLLAAPGAQTILLPNVISEADRQLLAALSGSAAWQSGVGELTILTRSPLGGTASNSLALGLEPVSGGSLPATVFGPGLAVMTNPHMQYSGGPQDGYITIVENDDPSLGDAPVALHVIKVTREKYRGSIAVLRPENVFDEKLTLRHTADFGGDVEGVFFEWVYREEDGRDLNPPGVNLPTAGTPAGSDWTVFASGAGMNEIQLSGASPATLTDNVFYVRYRSILDSNLWSAWGGAANSREPRPSSPSAAVDIAYVAQLAPGWIKRVTDAVNAFDARIHDFRNNDAPATYTSMIQQAGQRWEGPVAFNPQKDAIENFGLIELYQTVLDRGKDLSINLSPGSDGVNTALLNAANRIAALYTLMGNEAMADAADPTVGFSTANGQFGRLAPVIHCFENQTGNLLEEELALLRGRSEAGARPAYNRLMWNFTNGSGEAAYVLNYGITDLDNDGFLTDADARRLYPQGHGDAWGHYTMALGAYYDLATLPNFSWSSRSEKYVIDGIVLDVDYLDERAFAKTAAARAQCGAQLVDLVYRRAYTENPNGQWQGYRDTNTDRAWGVLETAQRSGTAALCDWLTGNALLKGEETDPSKTGIRRVDRGSVGELKLIAAQGAVIQAKLDSSDRGMNPAGLDPDVVPFDIDPVLTDRTNDNAATHFEQIYSRAVAANQNALTAFNHANQAGIQVRRTAANTEDLRRQAQDQDLAYRNKLIEYFGTPYGGMIGGGKAYPEGYTGPDLYLWMYLDQVSAGKDVLPELDNDIVSSTVPAGLRNLATDTNPFNSNNNAVDDLLKDSVSLYYPADLPFPIATPGTITLNLPRQAKNYAFVAPANWGQRHSPGRIQAALQELIHAEWRVRMAVNSYEGTTDDFKLLLRKFEAKSGIAAEKIRVAASAENKQDHWHNVATGTFISSTVLENVRELVALMADGFHEAFPRSVGLAVDATSPARSTVKIAHAFADSNLRAVIAPLQITQYRSELEADEALVEMDQALLTEDLKAELVDLLSEIEALVNAESGLRANVIDAVESMRSASDRVRTVIQEGLAVMDERTVFNQRVAATTTQQRYEDFTFRVTHTESLRKYQSAFDLAGRYAYLAGKAYAYELNLPDNHAANAAPLLAEMLRTRSLGEWNGSTPVVGQGGIAEQLAVLKANFDTLKGQLGFNNPATEVNSFSVRAELGRVGLSSRVNADWRTKLETYRVPDLWNHQFENNGVNYGYVFRRYCRPFAPEAAGAQPALVIPFDSAIAAGSNWFGKTLAGGDSSFNASSFSTKIRSAGIRFDGYNNTALSQTPQVYLVPVGLDRMFLPDSPTLADRSWNVVDQRIPVPLPISPSNFADSNWQPYSGSASGFFEDIRKFSSFRAYHDAGGYSSQEMLSSGRLVGRSVWNSQWVLIIPSATLLYDADNPSAGIDTFIYGAPLPGFTQSTAGTANRDLIGARDIRILLQTYSISGN